MHSFPFVNLHRFVKKGHNSLRTGVQVKIYPLLYKAFAPILLIFEIHVDLDYFLFRLASRSRSMKFYIPTCDMLSSIESIS